MQKKVSGYFKKAMTYPSKIRLFWDSMGPEVITGAADDDPSGIGTYAIAGAKLGTKFLWIALLTWPLMVVSFRLNRVIA